VTFGTWYLVGNGTFVCIFGHLIFGASITFVIISDICTTTLDIWCIWWNKIMEDVNLLKLCSGPWPVGRVHHRAGTVDRRRGQVRGRGKLFNPNLDLISALSHQILVCQQFHILRAQLHPGDVLQPGRYRRGLENRENYVKKSINV
jgi:hypothetical protein